jgi:hypothetical protein
MKSHFLSKILLFVGILCQFSCNEPKKEDPSRLSQDVPSAKTTATVQTDTTRSENFATAQIALNIETGYGNTLANAFLQIYAPLSIKGTYRVKTLNADEGAKGPFTNFSIIDKAVISKNGLLKVLITYQIQAQRIHWETDKGVLSGKYGETAFKDFIKSEGGALTIVATIVFDEKNMALVSQSSYIDTHINDVPQNIDAQYEPWMRFAINYLAPRLVTTVNWTNADCKTRNCTTGQVRELK